MNRTQKYLQLSVLLCFGAAFSCSVINRGLQGEAMVDGGTTTTDSDGANVTPRDAGVDAMEIPTIDLAVHYEFEGAGVAVSDSSGRGFHGTLSDLSARTTEGRTIGGITLSGDTPATQFVELPSGILDGVDDFTIAVWIKLTTVNAWSRIYDIGNGLPDPGNRFMYLTPSGASGIHAASFGGSPANESTLTTATQLPINVWKHIALTGRGGDRTMYIDGFPAMTITGTPDVPPFEMEPSAPNSWLGKSRFAVDPGLNGSMDDFRIYGTVLSPTQIADLAWPQKDYSYWRFDNSATDSSDNAIATALVEGATWADQGRLGQALDLGGAVAGLFGPHVALNSNPLEKCTDEMSIAFWIKLRSLDTNAHVFDFGKEDNSTYMYFAPSDGTGMHFQMMSPNGVLDLNTTHLLSSDDTWHHVALTMNANNLVVLYIDGIIATTKTSEDVRPVDFSGLDSNLLGKSRFASDPYLNGSIDELRIGCRTLSSDEIRNLSRP